MDGELTTICPLHLLQKMLGFHQAMDDVSTKLHEAEAQKTKWVPVGEIIIDSLPQHIAEMKVSHIDLAKMRGGKMT